MRIEDARRIRANDADLTGPASVHHGSLNSLAIIARLGKAASEHDRALHALDAALSDESRYSRRRRAYQGKINWRWNVINAGIAAQAKYLGLFRIDRID